MICVRNLRLNVGETERRLCVLAARALRISPAQIKKTIILKKSLDARKKSDIHWLYSLACEVDDEDGVLARCPGAERYTPYA